MDELSKIRRVMGKLDADAPHEVMLVLDSTTGQNALSQANEFLQVVDVSGLSITKLDGSARGGGCLQHCARI
jgi:fused signal recognition particle receptor